MAGVIGSPIVAGAAWLAVVAFIAWDGLRGVPRAPARPGLAATGAANPAPQRAQFTRGRARIVAGSCGVLVVATAVACARLIHEGRLLIVILLAVSAVCVGGIAAYYELAARVARYRRGHWPAAAFAAPALISCTAAVSFMLYPMLYPQPPAKPPPPLPPPLPPSRPFSITPGWGIYAPSSRSGLSDLAMVGQYAAGVGLQPINWLVHVTLANNRPIPTTIIGLWATAAKFVAPGGPPQWQQFCNVTLHQQRLFQLYPSLRDTTEYSTAESLDGRLVDQTIPAHGTCPDGWPGTARDVSAARTRN